MQKFKSVDELVSQLKPSKPVYCIRKHSIHNASKFFQKKFPGKVLYAVKTNPHPEVLKTIVKSGINNFDVASVEEIKTIKVINPEAIRNLSEYVHFPSSSDDVEPSIDSRRDSQPETIARIRGESFLPCWFHSRPEPAVHPLSLMATCIGF